MQEACSDLHYSNVWNVHTVCSVGSLQILTLGKCIKCTCFRKPADTYIMQRYGMYIEQEAWSYLHNANVWNVHNAGSLQLLKLCKCIECPQSRKTAVTYVHDANVWNVHNASSLQLLTCQEHNVNVLVQS